MSADRLDLLDYYTLLRIEGSATPDEIRAAYHRFALRYHPDNHLDSDPARVARATRIFQRGAEAYRVLLDPELRPRYDAGLRRGQLRFSPEDTPSHGSRRPPPGQVTLRSRKARPFFRKAEQAIAAEDWQTAKLNLQIALTHEPGNAMLEEKLALVKEKRGR